MTDAQTEPQEIVEETIPEAEQIKPESKDAEIESPEVVEPETEETEKPAESIKDGVPVGLQKRIDRLVANNKLTKEQKIESDRRIQALESQLQVMAQQHAVQQPVQQQNNQQIDPNEPVRPSREQFTDPFDYADAVASYKDRKSSYDAQKQQLVNEQSRYQSYVSNLDAQHNERIEQAKERYEDFDEVSDNLLLDNQIIRHPNFQTMAFTVMSSEKSADLQYYLANNRKEAERLLSLSPLQAAAEIGKLEMKLSVAPPKVSKQVAAPTSVKSNPSGNATAAKKSLDERRREAYLKQQGII